MCMYSWNPYLLEMMADSGKLGTGDFSTGNLLLPAERVHSNSATAFEVRDKTNTRRTHMLSEETGMKKVVLFVLKSFLFLKST